MCVHRVMHHHSIDASFDCLNQAGVPFYRDVGLVRYHSIEMLVLVTCNSFRVEHDHSIELNSSLLTHAGRIFKPDTRTLSKTYKNPNPLFVKHNAASSCRPTSTLRLPGPLWIWVHQMVRMVLFRWETRVALYRMALLRILLGTSLSERCSRIRIQQDAVSTSKQWWEAAETIVVAVCSDAV